MTKLSIEMVAVILLFKLLKVAYLMEFVLWKLLGTVFKLEATTVLAGGNLNKLISMCAEKLRVLERRVEEARGDFDDTGRNITTYLVGQVGASLDYLAEGVRRVCQSFVESRKINKDCSIEELESLWQKVKKNGFDHASAQLEAQEAESTAVSNIVGANKIFDHRVMLGQVFNQPTEKIDEY